MRRMQTYEQWRQAILDETARFIEWGLRNPAQVPQIPTYPVGGGGFTPWVKRWFWEVVLRKDFGPGS